MLMNCNGLLLIADLLSYNWAVFFLFVLFPSWLPATLVIRRPGKLGWTGIFWGPYQRTPRWACQNVGLLSLLTKWHRSPTSVTKHQAEHQCKLRHMWYKRFEFNNVIAIHSQEPRERMLFGWEGHTLSPLSITERLAIHGYLWGHVCGTMVDTGFPLSVPRCPVTQWARGEKGRLTEFICLKERKSPHWVSPGWWVGKGSWPKKTLKSAQKMVLIKRKFHFRSFFNLWSIILLQNFLQDQSSVYLSVCQSVDNKLFL